MLNFGFSFILFCTFILAFIGAITGFFMGYNLITSTKNSTGSWLVGFLACVGLMGFVYIASMMVAAGFLAMAWAAF